MDRFQRNLMELNFHFDYWIISLINRNRFLLGIEEGFYRVPIIFVKASHQVSKMLCLGKWKDKHKGKHGDKDKYKNNRQTYDVICFRKGDDKRSLIMQNMQNMQNHKYTKKKHFSFFSPFPSLFFISSIKMSWSPMTPFNLVDLFSPRLRSSFCISSPQLTLKSWIFISKKKGPSFLNWGHGGGHSWRRGHIIKNAKLLIKPKKLRPIAQNQAMLQGDSRYLQKFC